MADHAPTLPSGGDVADILADENFCGLPLGDAAELADVGQLIERLADAAPVIETPTPEAIEPAAEWRPFPVEVLPEPWRSFVIAAAKAIGCDASYVALPLLVVLAAAIGNTRRMQLKRGWYVPAILWGVIVGESGTAKTPAFRLVLKPVRERQRKALERHAEAMRLHGGLLQVFEANQKAWQAQQRKAGEHEPPPEKPAEPISERCIVSDTTVEALAPILLANPRGLLLARDELNGWLGSFDRYASGGKGADSAHYLSMYGGESIVVDRKKGEPKTIFVPHAAMSIIGGIQPGVLHRALGQEHRESGLAARLLLAFPPRQPKRWTEADIDPEAEAEIAELLDRLFALQPTENDTGELLPAIVKLTPEAKAVWLDYHARHNAEQVELAGELSAAWSKLEEAAARLALVCYLAKWAAAGDAATATTLDAESMTAGVTLAEWFKHEAKRAYGLLGEDDGQRERRELLAWIRSKGGRVTVRDLAHGPRPYRGDTEGAEQTLRELVKAGYGQWEPLPAGPRGGKPSRVFVLKSADAGPVTYANPEENEVMVPVPVVPRGKCELENEATRESNSHAAESDINAMLFDAAEENEGAYP
ncbi:MAG: DUF3987 domain-containing protein [Planctomycetes bacterium]|nr:DUF3987 domain-containing protein [Planctomycetota bacterium]